MNDTWLSEDQVPEAVSEAPAISTLHALRRALRRAALVAGVALTVAAAFALLRKATHAGQPEPDVDWEEVTGM
jgi:negative regulator of sigma E activity